MTTPSSAAALLSAHALYDRKEKMSKIRFEYHLASRNARLSGVLLDGVISALVVIPILFFTGGFSGEIREEASLGMELFQFFLGWAIFFMLNGYFLVKKGQTLGKMIVSTKIVNKKGKTPSPLDIIGKRYLIPSLIYAVPVAGQVFSLVNALFIFREDKRCVHDHIAGTYVVEA